MLWVAGLWQGRLGDRVSLARVTNGQVYKVATSEANNRNFTSHIEFLGILYPVPKETIAAVNHWRYDGFPLYGQVKLSLVYKCPYQLIISSPGFD